MRHYCNDPPASWISFRRKKANIIFLTCEDTLEMSLIIQFTTRKPDIPLSEIGQTSLQLKFSGRPFLLFDPSPKSRLDSNGSIATGNTKRSNKRVRELHPMAKHAGKVNIQNDIKFWGN